MSKAILKQIHPVLPVRDVSKSISYYVDNLGFNLSFRDVEKKTQYAGVIRDNIELHLQWHNENDWVEGMESLLLKIYVDKVDTLFQEFDTKGILPYNNTVKDTAWKTREFGIYDTDKNGLIFYKNL
nr:glyoxalase superfamily protein [uncultured Psychroserpens sp.]